MVTADQVFPEQSAFWKCNGDSAKLNPFYSMKLQGVRDFAGKCPEVDKLDYAALTDAQRNAAFECSLGNYGVGAFNVQVLPNKHWDLKGKWKLQLEVGTLLRSKLDDQLLSLLPASYKDSLPASFPDLSLMHTEEASFFSAGSYVESWASRAATTLRGHFLQCANYHGDQTAAVAKDCLQLLSGERQKFCSTYETEEAAAQQA